MSEYKIRTINGKKVPEHRATVEEALHITLGKDQVVHHINGDKRDNRIENLQVMDRAEHSRKHAAQMPQTPEKQRKISEREREKATSTPERSPPSR